MTWLVILVKSLFNNIWMILWAKQQWHGIVLLFDVQYFSHGLLLMDKSFSEIFNLFKDMLSNLIHCRIVIMSRRRFFDWWISGIRNCVCPNDYILRKKIEECDESLGVGYYTSNWMMLILNVVWASRVRLRCSAMDIFTPWLIICNGKRLVPCFQILTICQKSLKFGLSTEGMNVATINHGLILLIIYNLSPLLCMRRYSFNGQKHLWRLFQVKY